MLSRYDPVIFTEKYAKKQSLAKLARLCFTQ